MSTVKLTGALPAGDFNGLGPIADGLLDDPQQMRVVIAIIDCKSTTTDIDSGEIVPTARIRRIEAVLDEDLSAAKRLVYRAREQRTGRAMLPLDLEDEVSAAFEPRRDGREQ